MVYWTKKSWRIIAIIKVIKEKGVYPDILWSNVNGGK